MQRKWLRILVFMTVPLLCAACSILPAEEELPAAPVIHSYETIEYELSVVMRGDIELTKKVKCTYTSAKQERYSFSLGGVYIDKVYVSEGQQVKKGALLAQLESGDLADQIADQEYAVRALEVRQTNLPERQRLELESQNTVLEGMEAQIDDLMAHSMNYEPGEERYELQRQANEILIRKLELEKTKDDLLKEHEKQRQEAEDALYIARLRLKELQEDLRERQIYADINGTVIYLQQVKEGDRSEKGKNFVVLADFDTVVFTVKGEDTQYFPVGTEVTVLCGKKELPVLSVEASKLGLSQKEEDEAVAYLQLLQPDPTLENGASGSIELTLDRQEDVLYVDKKAIKSADGAKYVYILDERGLRVLQEVTTGLENGTYVEIVSGLAEGDSVILD